MKQENEDIARKMQYILNMRPVFNKEALFSDGTRYYRNPTEPKSGEKVIISFRTQKNNVDAVYLVSGDQKYKMKVYKTTKGFDYYGTKIVMPEEIFRYHFEIQYGWATCYYTEQGVCSELQEWAQFEIYPNYHTPDWAKGAVMYQIFVDRFRNGDPSNDVESDEYAYIGEHSEKVTDWSKTPAVMGVREFYGGDLQGIIDKLDYFEELGVEVLYQLGHIFAKALIQVKSCSVARLPQASNVVVELNPDVIAVARSLFALPEDERLQVIHGDGVDYVSQATAEFDTVLVDAFDGHDLIAAMVAEPFLHDCRQALTASGVLVMNLWGNHPHYRRHVDCLRQVFDGRVLTLPAASHGNVAALALASSPGHSLRLDALEARARQLTADVELDFMAMVAALKRDNPHTASRLLP
mgnify:CR=1 FL=1